MPPAKPHASKVHGISIDGEKIIQKKFTCSTGPMRREKLCENCDNPKWRLRCCDSYTLCYTHSKCLDKDTVNASSYFLEKLDEYKQVAGLF